MAKLYFYFGAMNAGKSTILLQSAYNYTERGMQAMLLKPAVDTRNGTNDVISSRIGLQSLAHGFDQNTDVGEAIFTQHRDVPVDCVFVDESQFLTKDQVWQLAGVADNLGIPVMCYGLRTDFKGGLFEGSATLLAVADSIKEIKTLCWCGRKATMTLRLSAEGEADLDGTQIEIGGNDRYISLCRRHWTAQLPANPA